MNLTDVLHQRRATATLQQALGSARVPHSYIFCGPDGVGKQTLAKAYAKRLLCPQPHVDMPDETAANTPDINTEACGHCESCRLCDHDSHPDYHEVHRQLIQYHPDAVVRRRRGTNLGIDVIRHFVVDAAQTKPCMGPNKIFVIAEAEKLNLSAQNALLKTLEEPPAGTHLILLAQSTNALLPTVRSRCQVVDFVQLPHDFVSDRVAALRPEVSTEALSFCANFEGGSIGRALSLLDLGCYDAYSKVVSTLSSLQRTDALKLASLIESQAKELAKSLKESQPEGTDTEHQRQATRMLLHMIATFYRDVTRKQHAPTMPRSHIDAVLDNTTLTNRPGLVRRALHAVAHAEAQINLNCNTRLSLENMTIELCRVHANESSLPAPKPSDTIR